MTMLNWIGLAYAAVAIVCLGVFWSIDHKATKGQNAGIVVFLSIVWPFSLLMFVGMSIGERMMRSE